VLALERKGYLTYSKMGRAIKVLKNPAGNDVRLVFEEVEND
jgi:hypothetical protein